VDLNELLADTLELTRDELLSRHITVATELREPLPAVEGGRIQLQQVFLNLVVNAADAMQDTKEAERRLVVRTEAKVGEVRVSVSDAGSGILARDVQKVFDPFWTTKSGGMGMGLAVCRSIVDAHRGALTAANNPDRGATFCVTLPAIGE
jgi:C4-dicarboxylate-specific signal transduction histidine kinase